jgi:hypothetical protein
MATTSNTYTGNGTNKLFSITFPYLDTTDIDVYLNGTLQTVTTQYTFANATTVEFVTAPANGATVLLDRSTDDTNLQATFFPGSSIKASDLNENFDQVLYIAQETANNAANQSTAGLQTQITAATNTANTAITTANAANATANGIAGTANTALSNSSSAVTTANAASVTATNAETTANTALSTANAALPTAGGTMTGNLNVPSINGGPIGGFRNVIINGNPTINQRGYVSGTATSGANQYTLDRWRVVTSGQSITFTDSANVRTVTAPAGGCEQVVEGLNLITGTYTLNWTGTATATVDGNAVAKGGNVTLTGGTNATVRFSSGTFSLAQLEVGTVATPFERRSYGQEFALCQRYYAIIERVAIGAYATSGGGVYATFTLPVNMRAAPTVTKNGTWSVTNCGQPIVIAASTSSFTAYIIATASGMVLSSCDPSAGQNFTAAIEL